MVAILTDSRRITTMHINSLDTHTTAHRISKAINNRHRSPAASTINHDQEISMADHRTIQLESLSQDLHSVVARRREAVEHTLPTYPGLLVMVSRVDI